ncbi:MAG: hypothetical protein HQ546_08410 [Planctomycetes bacterium]|nr:hypothetical protein [Planctomycetota bacterium]
MAITFEERVESRRRNVELGNDTAELVYVLTGSSSDVTVKAMALAGSATTYDSLIRQSIQIEPVPETIDSVNGTGVWNVIVRYGVQPAYEAEDWALSFDTTGGTQHITQALTHVADYAPGGITPLDNDGAIGVAMDGKGGGTVEGVDVVVPVWNFTLRRKIPIDNWTASYVTGLYALTAKVNDAGFWISIRGSLYEFSAGEVLFLGASGDESTDSDYVDVSYRFSASPNRANFTIGSGANEITVVSKKGWDYLWVQYWDAEATDGIIKVPVSAHVEKVYADGDFSIIGSI